MFKIKTLNAIAATGLQEFPSNLYEVGNQFDQPDGILLRSHSLHNETIPESVKVIGRAGAGTNNIPTDLLTKIGVPVLNTPGANANAVRELVLAGMLLASRNICAAWNYVDKLTLQDAALDKKVEQDKKQFVGFELMGKTLGVIGLGSIGVKVANAALNLGMKVIGYDPTITVHRAWELSSNVAHAKDMNELLTTCDFVTLHVPLNPETQNFINTARLKLMKKNSVLLNFSREGIIDHSALMDFLKEKKLLAYVCDFPNAELKKFSQVICLPHLGASTLEAEENCAVMVVKQVRDFLENGSITHSVNFPSIEMPQTANSTRLAVVNVNVPNMVAQISSTLGSANLNILSLLNKSRDDIAYTLIDVNKDIDSTVLNNLSHIQGVIKVRKVYYRN